MALEGKGRVFQSEASRTLIYVSQRLANDSAWPFTSGDALQIKIEGTRLVVEKASPADAAN